MKPILLLLLTAFWTCCFGVGEDTNSLSKTATNSSAKLAPLPLEYPAPSLGGNGPIVLPVGPHFEPFNDGLPAPFWPQLESRTLLSRNQ